MIELEFDSLLEEADVFAQGGEWGEVFRVLSQAVELNPTHAGALTGLATSLLNLGEISEAEPYIQKVVDLAPDSPEAHNNLGVAFSLGGQLEEAETAFLQAIDLNPEHVQAWKNLAQVYLQQEARLLEGVEILAAVVKAHPEDVEAKLTLAQCYEIGNDVESAVMLYEEVVKVKPDEPEALEALGRLRPQRRDVARIAQNKHIEKLARLGALKEKEAVSTVKRSNGATPQRREKPMAVAFYGSPSFLSEKRIGLISDELAERDVRVKLTSTIDPQDVRDYDVLVFSMPHENLELMKALEDVALLDKPVVVDLNEDVYNFPGGRRRGAEGGFTGTTLLENLREVLPRVSLVTVPGAALADGYRQHVPRVEEIPFGWDQGNRLWGTPAPQRDTVNVGIISAYVRPEDINLVKNGMARLIQEFEETLLVIGWEPSLLEVFKEVPEKRKYFLPMGNMEDYPFMLAHFDILLAPFDQLTCCPTWSDLPLVEAGARGIPWVASPHPIYEVWGVGGQFARKRGDWYQTIRRLLEDPEQRATLGHEGREKAAERKSSTVVDRWLEVLKSLGG